MASNSNCASCNSSMYPPCFGARTWPFTRSSRSSGGILRGDEGRRIWFGLFWPPPHRLSLRVPNMQLNAIIGIGSMYGIFAYICLKFMVNVGKYTIQDGSYGIVYFFSVKQVDESFLVDFGGCLFGCSPIFICSRYLTKTMVYGSDCVFLGVARFDYTKDVIVSVLPKVCACVFLWFFFLKVMRILKEWASWATQFVRKGLKWSNHMSQMIHVWNIYLHLP